MSTFKQKLVAATLLKNGGNLGKAMLAAGYSPATAHTPSKLTSSKGWQKEIAPIMKSLKNLPVKEVIHMKKTFKLWTVDDLEFVLGSKLSIKKQARFLGRTVPAIISCKYNLSLINSVKSRSELQDSLRFHGCGKLIADFILAEYDKRQNLTVGEIDSIVAPVDPFQEIDMAIDSLRTAMEKIIDQGIEKGVADYKARTETELAELREVAEKAKTSNWSDSLRKKFALGN